MSIVVISASEGETVVTDESASAMVANPHYDWSPIVSRPALVWPGKAAVAVVVLVTVERMEWYPPSGRLIPPTLRKFHQGVYPRVPDLVNTSLYEYGNRVGFFRVMDVLHRHGIPATIAADARLLDQARALVDYGLARGAEFIGHGVAGNRFVTEAVPEAEERTSIERSIDSIRRATGKPPLGWHNPEYSASTRTLALLADHGVEYVVDWPTDEQPHEMRAGASTLVNLPAAVELDDVLAHMDHALTAPQLADIIVRQLDRLVHDGRTNGRLLVLNVHPWLSGQPYRIGHLARVVERIAGDPAVWAASGYEVSSWFRAHGDRGSPDRAVRPADSARQTMRSPAAQI